MWTANVAVSLFLIADVLSQFIKALEVKMIAATNTDFLNTLFMISTFKALIHCKSKIELKGDYCCFRIR